MKSKIRVEYDFDKREPYLQLYIESSWHGESDMRDQMLKSFIEEANYKGVYIMYPENNQDNSVPQIRIGDGKFLTPIVEQPEDRQFD